jgi:hypothetical protein
MTKHVAIFEPPGGTRWNTSGTCSSKALDGADLRFTLVTSAYAARHVNCVRLAHDLERAVTVHVAPEVSSRHGGFRLLGASASSAMRPLTGVGTVDPYLAAASGNPKVVHCPEPRSRTINVDSPRNAGSADRSRKYCTRRRLIRVHPRGFARNREAIAVASLQTVRPAVELICGDDSRGSLRISDGPCDGTRGGATAGRRNLRSTRP